MALVCGGCRVSSDRQWMFPSAISSGVRIFRSFEYLLRLWAAFPPFPDGLLGAFAEEGMFPPYER